MKKFLISIILCLLVITGCGVKDSVKFKHEYEALNGEKVNGKLARIVEIGKENPMKYITEEEIIEKLESKESFIVYFGFAECPWCRSVLSYLLTAASDNNIDTIYYLDVSEIRDTLKFENDEIKTEKEGTKGYYKLLERFDSVLNQYTIDEKDMGEKRIYAPNIISVVHGTPIKMISGLSSLQTDPYMDFTTEMINEMYDNFDSLYTEFNEKTSSCEIGGC